MPVRQRFRGSDPDNITVIGGGGGGGGEGNVEWGPAFGAYAGSDTPTFSLGYAIDLAAVGLQGDLGYGLAIDLDRLELQNWDPWGIGLAVDLDQIGLQGDLGLGLAVDLAAVGLQGDLGLGLAVDLDQIGLQADLGFGMALSGIYTGPPQIVDEEYVANDTGLGGGSQAINVPTHIENDLLLIVVNSNGNAAATADQGGWTTHHTVNQGNSLYRRVFSRFATGAEPATYSFTTSAAVATNAHICIEFYSIRGADPTTPVDDVQSATASDRTTTVSVPAATAGTAFSLVLACGSILNTLNATQTNYTWTQPGGYLELVDHQSGPATPIVANPLLDCSVARIFDETAGAIPAANFTFTPQPLIATTVGKIGTHIVVAHDPAGVPL